MTWWNRYDHLSTNDDLETDRDNEIAMEHLQFHISRDDSEAEKDDQSHDGSENLADESGDTSMNKSDTHGLYCQNTKHYHDCTSWRCLGKKDAILEAWARDNPTTQRSTNLNQIFLNLVMW